MTSLLRSLPPSSTVPETTMPPGPTTNEQILEVAQNLELVAQVVGALLIAALILAVGLVARGRE